MTGRESSVQVRLADMEQPQLVPYTSINELLTNLNRRLIECMNQRDYYNPLFDLITPDCHIDLHGKVLKGPEGYIQGYKEVVSGQMQSRLILRCLAPDALFSPRAGRLLTSSS